MTRSIEHLPALLDMTMLPNTRIFLESNFPADS